MALFSKEPAEKKAFWKAFDAARSKPGEKTFPELEKACAAWPISWQGYLLMGLCYDMGAGVPFDENKASEYHYKAKEAGRKCNSEWVEIFYEYYEQDALNFRAKEKYFPRTLKVRKAGVAMLFSYYINTNGIIPKGAFGGDDLKFWDKIFSKVDTGGVFKSTPEQEQVYKHRQPFTDWIMHFNYYKNAKNDEYDNNQRVKYFNEMLKHVKKFDDIEPDKITTNDVDLYDYVVGCALFFGGIPYLIRGTGWYENLRIDAWMVFWTCAKRGCAPAAHMLATYIDEPEFSDEIYFAATKRFNGFDGPNYKEEIWKELRWYLRLCEEQGDMQATYLLDQKAQ